MSEQVLSWTKRVEMQWPQNTILENTKENNELDVIKNTTE